MTSIQSVKEHMAKTINLLREQLVGFQPNVSIALVETVKVPYYSQQVVLKTLASVTIQNNRISIEVFDPSIVKAVEKSLISAGLNAYIFSKKTVCVNIPPMSGEQKEKILSRIKVLGEEAKVSIRNIRRAARKEIDNDDALQKLTDECVEEIQEIVNHKSRSI